MGRGGFGKGGGRQNPKAKGSAYPRASPRLPLSRGEHSLHKEMHQRSHCVMRALCMCTSHCMSWEDNCAGRTWYNKPWDGDDFPFVPGAGLATDIFPVPWNAGYNIPRYQKQPNAPAKI